MCSDAINASHGRAEIAKQRGDHAAVAYELQLQEQYAAIHDRLKRAADLMG
jgi:hypothetical protein